VADNEKVGGLEWEAEINFDSFDQSVAKLNQMMNETEKPTKKVEQGLKKVEDQAKKTSSVFDGLFKRFTAANIVANTVVGAFTRITSAIAQFIKGTIRASSDLTELDSKARVVFGESFPAIAKQADSIAKEVGRASSTILQFATDMGAIISSFGIAGPLLDQMSTQFAKLSVDMASFMNTSDDEAFAALRSGITGETEPLKRFGIVLTDTNLQLFAFEKGIKTKVQAMNQAQKTALRYAFIMDKTALAQGDAARTAATYANQSRRLGGEIKTLQEQLGKAVTPALANALGTVSSAIQNVRIFVSLLIQDIKSLFSILNISISGSSIGARLKDAALNVVDAVNPIAGAFLRRGKSPAQKLIQQRISAAKAGEASTQELIDPLANFESLGGASGSSGGGAAEAAEKLEKAEEAILKALGEQADANKENLDLRRSELLLRVKLGIATDKESRELERINRRIDYKTDAIEDATRAWEEQVEAIERVEERIKDLNEEIVDERKKLKEALAEIDEEADRDAIKKAAELMKERNDILKKQGGSQDLSGDDGRRLGELSGELSGFNATTLAEAERFAGLTDAQKLEEERALRREDAEEKANARIAELQAELDAERTKLEALRAAETEKKNIVIQALAERLAVTSANFAAIEERTTAHVNQQIAEFNRLRASLSSSPAPIPAFASGGPVIGPGTGTSDSILARLSNGEYVVPAAETRMYRPILEAIRNRTLPRFADGGEVTHNNQKSAQITINNHGRAAEALTDPRRAKWYAQTYF